MTIILMLLFAVEPGAPVSPPVAGENCVIAVKGTSPVAKACAEGGVKRAKVVMKAIVKAAKAAGT